VASQSSTPTSQRIEIIHNGNGVRKRQRLTGLRERRNGNGMVETGHNPRFPPFRCRSSVAVSPFCPCKITLFCKNYVRKKPFRYSRKQQKDTQRQRCTETATANGNGETETATEERQRNGGNHFKPGISDVSFLHRSDGLRQVPQVGRRRRSHP